MQTHFSGSDFVKCFWQADRRAMSPIGSCLSPCPANCVSDCVRPVLPDKGSTNSIAMANWGEIRCSAVLKCVLLSGLGHRCCVADGWTCSLSTQMLPVSRHSLLGQETGFNPVLGLGSADPSWGLLHCWGCRCRY